MVPSMNTHYLHSLIDESVRTVGVRFNTAAGTGTSAPLWSQKVYTYKTREPFSIDDLVVVEVPAGMSVAKVVRVDDDPQLDANTSLAYRWVVQKVDLRAYNALVDDDKRFEREIMKLQRKKHRESLRDLVTKQFPELTALVLKTVPAAEPAPIEG